MCRRPLKVVVSFERRDDGGLRAYSDDVPGFVLSHRDPVAVIRDIEPVLGQILSAMWGVNVRASLLAHVGDPMPDDCESPESVAASVNHRLEYVAHIS